MNPSSREPAKEVEILRGVSSVGAEKECFAVQIFHAEVSPGPKIVS